MIRAVFVYLVQWDQDGGRCLEVFGDRESAVAYANKVDGSSVTSVSVRGMDYVNMVFGKAHD